MLVAIECLKPLVCRYHHFFSSYATAVASAGFEILFIWFFASHSTSHWKWYSSYYLRDIVCYWCVSHKQMGSIAWMWKKNFVVIAFRSNHHDASSWESNFLLQFAPPYTFIRTKKISLSHEFSSARPQNERRKILDMFYQSMFLHIWSTWNWFFLVILVQTAFLTSIANPRSDKLKFFHIQFKLQ